MESGTQFEYDGAPKGVDNGDGAGEDAVDEFSESCESVSVSSGKSPMGTAER